MKKILLTILLALVLSFSFAVMACTPTEKEPEETDPTKEIEFTVDSDKDVPAPTYSNSFKNSAVDLIASFMGEADEAEIKQDLEQYILPLLSKAKVSESSLKEAVDYVKNNEEKIIELIGNFLLLQAEEFDDEELKGLFNSYYTIYVGLINVLNPDDAGKLIYVLLSDTTSPMYDTDVAEVVKGVGRDNFIILSRFMFKMVRVSLTERAAMIDSMVTMFNLTFRAVDFEEGYYDTVSTLEMFAVMLEMLEAEYRVYQSITDNEINKLIEIGVDFYAALIKAMSGEEISANEKASMVSEYKAMVADFRALISLAYKTAKNLDVEKLATSDGSLYLFEQILNAYDTGITAAERATITNLLKDIADNLQYYKIEKELIYDFCANSYYDYSAEVLVHQCIREYSVTYVKTTTKQFDTDLISDPVDVLRTLLNMGKKLNDNEDYELNEDEQEIIDFFEEYYMFILIASYDKLGLPTNDIFDGYDWDPYEIHESMTYEEYQEWLSNDENENNLVF